MCDFSNLSSVTCLFKLQLSTFHLSGERPFVFLMFFFLLFFIHNGVTFFITSIRVPFGHEMFVIATSLKP